MTSSTNSSLLRRRFWFSQAPLANPNPNLPLSEISEPISFFDSLCSSPTRAGLFAGSYITCLTISAVESIILTLFSTDTITSYLNGKGMLVLLIISCGTLLFEFLLILQIFLNHRVHGIDHIHLLIALVAPAIPAIVAVYHQLMLQVNLTANIAGFVLSVASPVVFYFILLQFVCFLCEKQYGGLSPALNRTSEASNLFLDGACIPATFMRNVIGYLQVSPERLRREYRGEL
ncbi:hypothetical protein C8J56DRAFT_879885 [Mycena floridula]|nr:hypothetical protein C8J56DRAFT_879885 [Mycena floridula]